MSAKEKKYLRMGCLFLVLGLCITFTFGDIRSLHKKRVTVDERAERAERVEQAEYVEDGGANDEIRQAFLNGSVKNLHISGGYGELWLYADASDGFYMESDRETSELAYVNGDTLYLSIGDSFDESNYLSVFCPENYMFQSVDVDVSAGSVNMEDLLCERLTASVGAGEFLADELVCEEFCNLDCGAGNIEVDALKTTSLKVETGVGRAELEISSVATAEINTGIGATVLHLPGRKEDYAYQVDTGAGTVMVDGKEYSAGIGISERAGSKDACLLILNNGLGTTELFFENEYDDD